MATSTLIIGATFAAFSYFAPILTKVTGIPEAIVSLPLLDYGAATVVGNIIVGRLAQSHIITAIVIGLLLNASGGGSARGIMRFVLRWPRAVDHVVLAPLIVAILNRLYFVDGIASLNLEDALRKCGHKHIDNVEAHDLPR